MVQTALLRGGSIEERGIMAISSRLQVALEYCTLKQSCLSDELRWCRQENARILSLLVKPRTEKMRRQTREGQRRWKMGHPQALKEMQWRYEQSGKAKARRQKRRALLVDAKTTIRDNKLIEFMWQDAKYCEICGKKFNKKRKKTIDHIRPLSCGGSGLIDNIQIACFSCNMKKGVKHYTKFNRGQFLLFVK